VGSALALWQATGEIGVNGRLNGPGDEACLRIGNHRDFAVDAARTDADRDHLYP